MGTDTVIPLAILGLVGCAMILAAVVLDYVKPQKYTGWTLGEPPDYPSVPRPSRPNPTVPQ